MVTQPSAVQHERWVLLKILTAFYLFLFFLQRQQSSPPLPVTSVKLADYVW